MVYFIAIPIGTFFHCSFHDRENCFHATASKLVLLLSKIGINICTNPVEYSTDSGLKLSETFSIEVNFLIILTSHRKLHVAMAQIRFKFSQNFKKKLLGYQLDLPILQKDWHI